MHVIQATSAGYTGRFTTAGFTLIEMMVSLALFTIVMTIAVGAFLSLIGASSQLQGEQTVMTSLDFAMDSMTREIRTGTRYFCDNNSGDTGRDVDDDGGNDDLTVTADCASGATSLSFVESGSSLSAGSTGGRISYFLSTTDGVMSLMRQVGYDYTTAQSLLSSDVKIKNVQFFVSGSDSSTKNHNTLQPTVTIIIDAQDPNDSAGKVYTLETTVTQRELDI